VAQARCIEIGPRELAVVKTHHSHSSRLKQLRGSTGLRASWVRSTEKLPSALPMLALLQHFSEAFLGPKPRTFAGIYPICVRKQWTYLKTSQRAGPVEPDFFTDHPTSTRPHGAARQGTAKDVTMNPKPRLTTQQQPANSFSLVTHFASRALRRRFESAILSCDSSELRRVLFKIAKNSALSDSPDKIFRIMAVALIRTARDARRQRVDSRKIAKSCARRRSNRPGNA